MPAISSKLLKNHSLKQPLKDDIETRFKARAIKGDVTAGIALLDGVLKKREAFDHKIANK